jgi:hypothetical protein
MSKSRASIFEEAAELDVSGFAPKSAVDTEGPAKEEVRAVSEAARFPSREPKQPRAVAAPKHVPRRHRTGRNVQLNLKAMQETVDKFYAITDKNGWVLGQTLEFAIQALDRELASK